MSEGIRFLTEKDLEYFQELAERGEAVILTISEEELLSLDFSKPVKSAGNGQMDIQEELDQWVKEYKDEFSRLYGTNQETVRESRQIREQIQADEDNDEEVLAEQTKKAERKSGGTKISKSSSNLAEYLAQVQIDSEKAEIINQAVFDGISDQVILLLLKGEYTADEMREMCDSLRQNKKST